MIVDSLYVIFKNYKQGAASQVRPLLLWLEKIYKQDSAG